MHVPRGGCDMMLTLPACPTCALGAHTHTVELDEQGNGTSSTTNGHNHLVLGWKCYKADGHEHPDPWRQLR